jgi:hypothetical protein
MVEEDFLETARREAKTAAAPPSGWELGTLFPEFDELARPIKRGINHPAVAALPISFRPALLAGVSRAIDHSAILEGPNGV